MIQHIIRNCCRYIRPNVVKHTRSCSQSSSLNLKSEELSQRQSKFLCRKPPEEEQSVTSDIIDTRSVDNRSEEIGPIKEQSSSVLEKCEEDISHVAPYLKPTFNFAAYVNKSETLQELLKMGVDLYKVEKIKGAPQFVLRLNFETDMKNHIMFLHDLGLSVEAIANFITKNPFIFKEDLDNLQVRVNYLKYKKFTDSMILRIVEKNPHLLSHSTHEIDKMLGFIKKQFGLTGDELRAVVTNKPKLVTYDQKHIKTNVFVVTEEMGFTPDELKKIVLKCPVVLMKNQNFILRTFEYIHKQMGIGLETIAEIPEVLTCRTFRVKHRHEFLVKLGRAQYDPRKPNYVSLLSLTSGNDSKFCTDVAKSTIQAYNAFLKTM